jgi:hypothetical protein
MNITHNGLHDGSSSIIVLNDEEIGINTGHTWEANKFFDTELASPLDIRFVVQELDDGSDDWAETSMKVSPFSAGSHSLIATDNDALKVTIYFRVEFFPVPLNRVWPNTRTPLLYKCTGFVDGPRWLDGNTTNGEVYLSKETDGRFTGTRWQLENLTGGGLGLNCRGNIEGPRWLDGNTRDGKVYLSPNTAAPYSGTHWKRVDASVGSAGPLESFYLECLGSVPGLKFLDGNTVNGSVSLAPSNAFESDQFSGARWQAYR